MTLEVHEKKSTTAPLKSKGSILGACRYDTTVVDFISQEAVLRFYFRIAARNVPGGNATSTCGPLRTPGIRFDAV